MVYIVANNKNTGSLIWREKKMNPSNHIKLLLSLFN